MTNKAADSINSGQNLFKADIEVEKFFENDVKEIEQKVDDINNLVYNFEQDFKPLLQMDISKNDEL